MSPPAARNGVNFFLFFSAHENNDNTNIQKRFRATIWPSDGKQLTLPLVAPLSIQAGPISPFYSVPDFSLFFFFFFSDCPPFL
jgi:hypothetical protein